MTDSNTYLDPVALPIGEVARLAGVTVPTIRNWERDGKIESFRTPGGQRRFRATDVAALLTPQSPPSVASPAAEGRPSPERVARMRRTERVA